MGYEIGPYKIFYRNKKIEEAIKSGLSVKFKEIYDKKLDYLANNPNHPSLNTKSLSISKKRLKELRASAVYEFRINMSYRCVFYMDQVNKRIIIACVGNHNEIQRYCK